MTTPSELAPYQGANAALVAAAVVQLDNQLGGLDWSASSVKTVVTGIYSAIVQSYRRSSSMVGLQLYGDLRNQADVGGAWRKVMAPDPDIDWLSAKVDAAFKVPAPSQVDVTVHDQLPGIAPTDATAGADNTRSIVTSRLSTSMQRMVNSGSRETVALTAAQDGAEMTRVPDKPGVGADPAHYVRVPTSMKPCAFCVMCASRSWRPYTSAAAAGGVVGTRGGAQRGTQKIGEKYHDHCACIAVPIFAGKPSPFDRSPYEEMYAKAYANAGTGSTKSVLAAMRQIYNLA